MTTPTPEALTAAELDALIDQSQCITYYTSSDEAERLIKKLAVALAALREQVAAKDADIAAIRELMNVYNLGGWTDAIAPMKRALAAEADNAALREQVEAFRREQIARSKIDPVTRLHNLCDHLADQRRESPFTAESLELADASYKELCADNAALRQEWHTVDGDFPRPHARYFVRRENEIFTATPCYGMHEPWWVPRLLGKESEPITMLVTDKYAAMRDGKKS